MLEVTIFPTNQKLTEHMLSTYLPKFDSPSRSNLRFVDGMLKFGLDLYHVPYASTPKNEV